MPGVRRTARWWAGPLLATIALVVVPACSGDDVGARTIGAAAYTAVIGDFLPPAVTDGDRPLVFVLRLGDEQFPLDDQVEMIADLEEGYDLRFVDELSAAIEEADEAPRDDGLVLGVGTITSEAPHTVRVEVYDEAGQVDAHRMTLVVRGGEWTVATREPVEPEVLVVDE